MASRRHFGALTFRPIRPTRNLRRSGRRYRALSSLSSEKILPLANLARSANLITAGRQRRLVTGTTTRPQTECFARIRFGPRALPQASEWYFPETWLTGTKRGISFSLAV